MEAAFTKTLNQLVTLFETVLENVVVARFDIEPDVAILKLNGSYDRYQVYVTEVLRQDKSRKYSYYILQGKQVFAGFDNASDPKALHLKYGDSYSQHRLEEIPHYHDMDKRTVELTDEMNSESFIQWLEQI
jgi:hypothetical protein